MDAPAEVLERLRKLHRLSKSDNPNEAAVAAAAAQRLMSRYTIDSAMLEEQTPSEEPESFTRANGYVGSGPLATWIMTLGSAVAGANRLRSSYSSSRDRSVFTFYGPRADVDLACEALRWLCSETERLAAEDKARAVGRGRSFWASWRNGCASTIGSRLRDAAEEARAERRRELTGPTADDYAKAAGDPEKLVELDRAPRYALAVVTSALAKIDERPKRIMDWQKAQGMKFRSGRARYSSSHDGHAAGRAAGKRARLER